ncbi:MAG: hypothetical protein JXR37_08275 [Kiritimatiellae bacterium]|nr:hypothetical protein [Kiritimatiellia bacterium]
MLRAIRPAARSLGAPHGAVEPPREPGFTIGRVTGIRGPVFRTDLPAAPSPSTAALPPAAASAVAPASHARSVLQANAALMHLDRDFRGRLADLRYVAEIETGPVVAVHFHQYRNALPVVGGWGQVFYAGDRGEAEAGSSRSIWSTGRARRARRCGGRAHPERQAIERVREAAPDGRANALTVSARLHPAGKIATRQGGGLLPHVLRGIAADSGGGASRGPRSRGE